MSQENAIYTGARYHDSDSFRGDVRVYLAERVSQNGTLSTMQFDMPRLAATRGETDRDKIRETEGKLEVV